MGCVISGEVFQMRFLIGFVVAAMFGVSAQRADAGDVAIYDRAFSVFKHTDQAMPARAKRLMKGRFRKGTYFGAIACTSTDTCAFELQHNTLETAIEYAMANCEHGKKPEEGACILYATQTPKGYEGGPAYAWVTTEALLEFQEYDGPAALATNDIGVWVKLRGTSLQDARNKVLRKCAELSEQTAGGFRKVYKCRILAEKDSE